MIVKSQIHLQILDKLILFKLTYILFIIRKKTIIDNVTQPIIFSFFFC